MATGSPRLVFGAASGITAEDLMFSTHLGSANMVLYSSAHSTLHSQSLVWDTAAGTRAAAADISRQFSARLSDGSLHHDRCFICCHLPNGISRHKQRSSGSSHCSTYDDVFYIAAEFKVRTCSVKESSNSLSGDPAVVPEVRTLHHFLFCFSLICYVI